MENPLSTFEETFSDRSNVREERLTLVYGFHWVTDHHSRESRVSGPMAMCVYVCVYVCVCGCVCVGVCMFQVIPGRKERSQVGTGDMYTF